MPALPTSLLLSIQQLFQPQVLRILVKSVAVTLLVFVAVAALGWWLLDILLARSGLEDELFEGAGSLRGLASALLAALCLWLVWRIVALAVIQFYADEIVLAVEQRHYPARALTARELPLAEQIRNALRAAGRALLANLVALPFALALLFTGLGTAVLFWLVNALLLGRELQDMVWLRHAHAAGEQAPVGRAERFLLGGAVAGLLLVPFLHFLAPVIGAASATHLVHRKNGHNPHD